MGEGFVGQFLAPTAVLFMVLLFYLKYGEFLDTRYSFIQQFPYLLFLFINTHAHCNFRTTCNIFNDLAFVDHVLKIEILSFYFIPDSF